MKIITPLILSCSIFAISLPGEAKASANNSLYLDSETIPATLFLAQDDTANPENRNTQENDEQAKEKDSSMCIFDSDRFCLANKVFDQEKKEYIHKLNFLGHSFLTIASGIVIGTTFIGINLYAIRLSTKWMEGIRDKNPSKFSVETSDPPEELHKSIKENCFCEKRIKQQFSEIQIRISRHKELMLYFYRQHFISISMTSGLALIAGICLIFIAQEGIGDANPALINIFITTTSAGILYQSLPGIFQQELNRESNRSLFLKYSDLGNTVLSYAATGKVRDSTQVTSQSFSTQLEADKFVHFIDRELARLNQLPIEFDATKVIKITDLQESINGSFNSGNAGDTPVGENGDQITQEEDEDSTKPQEDENNTPNINHEDV